MKHDGFVELTVRHGAYGEHAQTVALNIPAEVMMELMGTVELSDDPFSLLLASPGMYGGKGDAVTIRRKAFQMRRDIARQIADAMVPALLQAFGVNDELDGYKVSQMPDSEREFYEKRGRLPKRGG